MPLTIALLNDRDLAETLGKRGTASDIQLYNYKIREKDLTIVYPDKYPEKINTLLNVLDMADMTLVAVREINKDVGEELIALSMMNFSNTVLILENYLTINDWNKIAKGTILENCKVLEKSVPALLDYFEKAEPKKAPSVPYVTIDHVFPVKGIGTVILGVSRGEVKRHEKLRLYPTDKIVEIKSVQVHDIDVNIGKNGERVGLALKDIEAEEVERGQVLAKDGSFKVVNELEIEGEIVGYYKGQIEAGKSFHASLRLALVPVKIESINIESATNGTPAANKKFSGKISLQKPLAVKDADKIVLVDMSAKGLRIVGSAAAKV